MKKIQVKHDLGRRLYGGQGQNKIGSAHLCHVGIAMHVWQFVESTQTGTRRSTKKIQVKHDLGSRLLGGQGQTK